MRVEIENCNSCGLSAGPGLNYCLLAGKARWPHEQDIQYKQYNIIINFCNSCFKSIVEDLFDKQSFLRRISPEEVENYLLVAKFLNE